MKTYIFISHSHVCDMVVYKSEYECRNVKKNKHISNKNIHIKRSYLNDFYVGAFRCRNLVDMLTNTSRYEFIAPEENFPRK